MESMNETDRRNQELVRLVVQREAEHGECVVTEPDLVSAYTFLSFGEFVAIEPVDGGGLRVTVAPKGRHWL